MADAPKPTEVKPAEIAKPLVDAKEALSVPQTPPPAKKLKWYRFVKNLNPEEKVVLSDGQKIEFYVAVKRDGHKSSRGTFDTADPAVAEKLRQLAKDKPSLYIFEG